MTSEQLEIARHQSIIMQCARTIQYLMTDPVSKLNEQFLPKMSKALLQAKTIYELNQCSKTGNYNS